MTEERQPPEIDADKLDFSRFHPLDHKPWRCWRRNAFQPIYGRTWHHLKIAWAFKWKGDLRAATLCRVNFRHRYGTSWHRPEWGADWVKVVPDHCVWCLKDKPS